MATQLLRTVDRWRFETPLALALAASAGFAALAMPRELFGRVPVAGQHGTAGHVALALLLAIVCGVVGYAAMRRPAKAVPVDEDADLSDDVDAPSGLSEDRLLRLRRADRHPDAPPRAPIRASRDLGEPFMDVGAFVPAPSADAASPQRGPVIAEGDYVEIDDPVADEAPVDDVVPSVEAADAAEPAVDDVEPEAEPAIAVPALGTPYFVPPVVDEIVAEDPVVEPVAATPIAPPPAITAPQGDASIAAMMERLSAGMQRRSGRPVAPARDSRPALRDALAELNRLAERRG